MFYFCLLGTKFVLRLSLTTWVTLKLWYLKILHLASTYSFDNNKFFFLLLFPTEILYFLQDFLLFYSFTAKQFKRKFAIISAHLDLKMQILFNFQFFHAALFQNKHKWITHCIFLIKSSYCNYMAHHCINMNEINAPDSNNYGSKRGVNLVLNKRAF